MADDADISQERMEAEMQRLMQSRQWNMLRAVGECHNCAEAFADGDDRRFCDADCLTDWQARMDANKRNGRG